MQAVDMGNISRKGHVSEVIKKKKKSYVSPTVWELLIEKQSLA